jgi:hypothetical protein
MNHTESPWVAYKRMRPHYHILSQIQGNKGGKNHGANREEKTSLSEQELDSVIVTTLLIRNYSNSFILAFTLHR